MQFNSSMPYNVMENDVFNTLTNTNALNPIIVDGIASQASTSQFRHDAFDLNFQNGVMSGYPVISSLQEEPNSGFGLLNSDTLASRSFRPNRVTEFQDHFAEGTPIPTSALALILASRTNCLQENVNISAPMVFPSQVLRSYASNECTITSHLSYESPLNNVYDNGVLGDLNSRWDFEKFLALPELSRINPPEREGFHPFRFMENMDQNPSPWISSNFNKELSLSLATNQPSVVRGPTFNEQCSDISSNETVVGSDQTSSSNSRDLSLSFGSYNRPAQAHFSQVISGSRYLNVVQDLLAEIARFSLENVDTQDGVNPQNYLSCVADKKISTMGTDECRNEDGNNFETDPIWQRRDIESKKAQLLSLLQIVDDRYNQCLDEIHTVISAFHAATELNPQMHARFALHTMSFLYKNIRERISNQILAMGPNYKTERSQENEESTFDTSFVQQQWALQHLRRKEHQLWRPQRGLPERSVSVLRAWMFQNFLHPYPKDAEKHLLAVKSGLTRSQVSNWFINARVRLWKPMIEEMYSEMNRRKARRGDDEGIDSNGRSSHITMDSERF